MRLLFSLFAFCATFALYAQLGVQSTANFNSASSQFVPGMGVVPGQEFDMGNEIAINYWFRLPKQRVEFLPTVYASTAKFSNFDSRLNEYGAQLKVNIYPFDFLGDCDCPTFGKQGPQLQKGFFLQLHGGYAVYDLYSPGLLDFEEGRGFTYGGGLGLDIGLSNLVTLTPMAGVRFGASPYQKFIYTDVNGEIAGEGQSKLTTLQAGLQVSFRFDHKKY